LFENAPKGKYEIEFCITALLIATKNQYILRIVTRAASITSLC